MCSSVNLCLLFDNGRNCISIQDPQDHICVVFDSKSIFLVVIIIIVIIIVRIIVIFECLNWINTSTT